MFDKYHLGPYKMSVEYKLTQVNDVYRLELSGNETATYDEYVAVVSEAKEKLSGNEEMELQTFVNVSHEAELEFFLSQGFYVKNTMLMMEKDLNETVDQVSSDMPAKLGKYDVSAEGLAKYLKANKMGFDGIQDPEDQIIYQIGQPDGAIYTAEQNGKILSSVTVWRIQEGLYATENIFTVPKYRGRHLSLSLLSFVLNEIKKLGAKKARLSVYGDDVPAILFYLKMGYHITDSNYELRY